MRAGGVMRRALLLAGAFAVPVTAQQQTGSPAGVPVPPAPVSSSSAGAMPGTTGSRIYRVHVIDGRNGSSMARARIELWYDEAGGTGTILETDVHGIAAMPEPLGLPVRVLLKADAHVDCRRPLRDAPVAGYNLQAIAAHGLATENTCGAAAEKPKPGELIFYVRPTRWYEGLNR